MRLWFYIGFLLLFSACTPISEKQEEGDNNSLPPRGAAEDKAFFLRPEDTIFDYRQHLDRNGYMQPGLYTVDETYDRNSIHRKIGKVATFVLPKPAVPGTHFKEYFVEPQNSGGFQLRISLDDNGKRKLRLALLKASECRYLGRNLAFMVENKVRYLIEYGQVNKDLDIILKGNFKRSHLRLFVTLLKSEINWVRTHAEIVEENFPVPTEY